jgi:growth factor-regulated tyrosine kinase substrate
MLEERLSKTYSQHSIGGYNLPAPRQATSPYPAMHRTGAPSASGPAESFYTGEQQAHYAPPHNYPQQPLHTPQSQFANYDKRGSVSIPPNSQYPQRTGSWQTQAPSAPAPYPGPGYAPSEPPPQSIHPSQGAPQPQGARVPEPVGTPTADPNAAFYYANSQQSQGRQTPSVTGETAPSPYPNLQQPTGYNMQSIPPTPASVPAQPSQPSQPPQQYQSPMPQQQQQYWQQPQHSGQAPQSYQPGAAAYPGFTQESFPSVPQHALAQPQQPVVEESLIDL